MYRVAHVEDTRFEDFVFEMTSGSFDLVITLVPLSGDADLYVTACGVVNG